MNKRFSTVMLNGKVWQLDCKYKVVRTHKPSRNIWEAYKKPSATKVEIWNEWCDYFKQLNADYITVLTKNSSFFSIMAYFEHEGITYRAYVSVSKQELSIVNTEI